MSTTRSRGALALALIAWLVFWLGPACAGEPLAEAPAATDHVESTLTLTEENDILANTDSNYTNGTRLQWISGDISRYAADHRLPLVARGLARLLPFLDRPDTEYNLGVSLGQLIYTPNSLHTPVYLPRQRPYAGWSYLSLALFAKTAYHLDTFEATLGMVGPSSLAGETQNAVHRLFGIREVRGWKHQIGDEPTAQIAWNHTMRAYRRDFDSGMAFDVLPHLGATAGNSLVLANVGLEMRVGYNLPWDFGTSLIRPGGGVSAPAPQDAQRPGKDHVWGAHLFVGVDGRAVARSIFLDGNTFAPSHSVPKNVFVGDVLAGVGLQMGRVKLTYSQVLRSQEFVYQKAPQAFGSLSLSVAF